MPLLALCEGRAGIVSAVADAAHKRPRRSGNRMSNSAGEIQACVTWSDGLASSGAPPIDTIVDSLKARFPETQMNAGRV